MSSQCCSGGGSGGGDRFDNMIPNCLNYANEAKAAGRPVVGIMCEYTPRELIMAAGGVPVCLCGGSADTIPAAETELPTNLCPLIKSTYGYHVQKSNPFIEMADLIVAETTCDGKKKMYEMMGRTRPMYVLELPQKADDPDAMAHWVAELRKFRAFLAEKFGVEITDDKIREATTVMNRERGLRRQLAEAMAADTPPMTGRELLKLKSSISGLCPDLQEYQSILDRLQSKCEASACEATPCQAAKKCCSSKRPVRVLMTGVPMAHGAERVLDLVEETGGVVVAMENCTGVKPIVDDVEVNGRDPIQALADKYFHIPCSVMTPNEARLESLRKLAEKYRPECIVDLIWQACLTYDVESNQVKRYAEEELKIPVPPH